MEYTPTQRSILVDLLVYGDDKAANISSRTGYHRNTISSNIKPLAGEGLLDHKGGGVYRLTDTGAEAARGLLRGGYNPYVDN